MYYTRDKEYSKERYAGSPVAKQQSFILKGGENFKEISRACGVT
jgi:hypothetical protein